LEWNEWEARVAVAAAHGKDVVVEQAFTVSLRPAQAGEAQPPVEVGKRLAAALAARRIGRMEALVAIGRTNIELRQLTVPPSPDEELPDLVRFQALREFNAMEEDWALDYVPIDEAPDQPRTVMAAAIGPEQIEQIQSTCRAAGLRARHLVLRPCAAASLFCRQQADARLRVRLLVDLMGEEADLTVMIDRKVIFLRTARLPADPLVDPEAAQALLGEFRRTMAAVQNQLGGRRVEGIILCGTGSQHAALAELIDQRLSVPAVLFDPFAGLTLAGDLARAAPEHPGRFAPLLGMLLDELHHDPHTVDFLHPRRRPEPPSQLRVGVYALVAVVVLLLAASTYVWFTRDRLSKSITSLNSEVTSAEARIKELEKTKKAVGEVDAWRSSDPVWLDELRWLSEKFPSAEEAIIEYLDLSNDRRTDGKIELRARAKSFENAGTAQNRLADEKHRIPVGPQRKMDSTEGAAGPHGKQYPIFFNTAVTIPREQRP
jgi:Tfp pilus assembly PilM family ATPase